MWLNCIVEMKHMRNMRAQGASCKELNNVVRRQEFNEKCPSIQREKQQTLSNLTQHTPDMDLMLDTTNKVT
jgi:hypothetical protein